MKKLLLLAAVPLLMLATGCAARTYSVVKDRVDQNLYEGNRGCLAGNCPQTETPRRMTRTTHVLEVELGKKAKTKPAPAVESAQSTYIPETYTSTIEEVRSASLETAMESYQVQKGDTLQKISQKFFGTTKKWHKIYKANEGILKSPDKLRPGMTINIPVGGQNKVTQPGENLK